MKSGFVYWLMVKLIRYWANRYMDQWEKLTVTDDYSNTVYVTFSYYDKYPESFVEPIKPGDLVVLNNIPADGVYGWRFAIEGKPIIFVGYNSSTMAELEFMDNDGHHHTIWVDHDLIKLATLN